MKKQINPSIKAHLLRSTLIWLSLLAICAIPLALAQSRSQLSTKDSNSPEQNITSYALLQPSAATHETRAGLEGVIEFPSAPEVTQHIETDSSAPPTRSSFMATWGSVSGAKGYVLDVSTSNSFSSYVDGYHDLDVGNVSGRVVTGLSPGRTYYYRVRPYDANGPGRYSDVMMVTTVPTTGPIIHPTFDSSITNNPNAAAIEAMINRVISIYESLFSDPITIQIRFRYSSTAPNGTPLPAGTVSRTQACRALHYLPTSPRRARADEQ